jgi:serine/threonine-protein kinase
VDAPTESSLPTLDGKYKLLRQLGEGGMGAVFEGRHVGTGRRCAVKVIASEALARSSDIVERFRREAMASGAVESQHIAQVLDTGVDPGTGSPYLVMELLVGEDVQHAVERLGPLPQDLALAICAQACIGLQKAHDAGIVHRDIKPANIFLAKRDRGEIVTKLLDFGIAKVKPDPQALEDGGSLTRTGSMLGSPLYMSPEQALGKKSVDHRTDIWSTGVVLYEMLTGTTPCGADVETLGQLIMKICSQPPRNVQEKAPWVKPEVAAIVHKALALEASARFKSAHDMVEAIERLLPRGVALHEKMFVKVSPQTRSIPAPKFGVPSDAMRAPAPSSNALPPLPEAEMARTVTNTTTAGFGHSWAPPAMTRARFTRGQLAGIGAGVAGMAVVLSVAWWLINAPRAEPTETTSTAPPAEELPTLHMPTPPVPTPATPAATTPVVTTPAATTAASATPPKPIASTRPTPTPPAARPPAPARAPANAATPKPGCDPPYTLDGAGNKHFKAECF